MNHRKTSKRPARTASLLLASALVLAVFIPVPAQAGNLAKPSIHLDGGGGGGGGGGYEDEKLFCNDGWEDEVCDFVCPEPYTPPTGPGDTVRQAGCTAAQDTAVKNPGCEVWYQGPYSEQGCPAGRGGNGGKGGAGGNGGDGCQNSTVVALNGGCEGGTGGGGGSGGGGGAGGGAGECTSAGRPVDCVTSPGGEGGQNGTSGEDGQGYDGGLGLWDTLGVNPFFLVYDAAAKADETVQCIKDACPDFPM